MSEDIHEKLGKHASRLDQLEKDKIAIFDLHNDIVVPALADVKVISKNVKESSALISRVFDRLDEVRDEQIACKARREAEEKFKTAVSTDNMNVLQRIGIWAGILTFIGGFFLGAYKFFMMLIKAAPALEAVSK